MPLIVPDSLFWPSYVMKAPGRLSVKQNWSISAPEPVHHNTTVARICARSGLFSPLLADMWPVCGSDLINKMPECLHPAPYVGQENECAVGRNYFAIWEIPFFIRLTAHKAKTLHLQYT